MRLSMKELRAKSYEKLFSVLPVSEECLYDSIRYAVLRNFGGASNTYKLWENKSSWHSGMNLVAEYHIGGRENEQVYKRSFDTFWNWLWRDFFEDRHIDDKSTKQCILSLGLSENVADDADMLRFYNAILAIGVLFKADKNIREPSKVLDIFMAKDYDEFYKCIRGCIEA